MVPSLGISEAWRSSARAIRCTAATASCIGCSRERGPTSQPLLLQQSEDQDVGSVREVGPCVPSQHSLIGEVKPLIIVDRWEIPRERSAPDAMHAFGFEQIVDDGGARLACRTLPPPGLVADDDPDK